MKILHKLIFLLFSFLTLTSNTQLVYASNKFDKYINNPIFVPGNNNWDTNNVDDPNVIKINNIYNLWFVASNSIWQIGYASSPNGIDNWNRKVSPIFSPGSSDGWEKATYDPHVIYDQSNSSYKMWYTSENSNNWRNGPDRFRTRLALSSDGQTWNKQNWVLTGSSGSWDSGGPGRGISIIYKDNLYHLWYGATNDQDLASSPYWRIGYATSPDGVSWTKQNGGKPVIEPTKSWELANVSYPTVIYKNGLFHMWYGAASWDIPTQIVYAYSADGITWIKPAEVNPVLTPTAGSFDQYAMFPSTVLDEEYLKLWYSGNDGVHWRIGYATASSSWIPVPTPTLTPAKKVVVIPGITASWNSDALLNCKTDGYSGGWTLFKLARAVYDPLLTSLKNAGYEPYVYPYDWRKEVLQNEPKLASYIASIQTDPNEKINIVGHSMGGLLARAYLDQEKETNKASKLLTVGTPHLGSAASYPTWESGSIWEGSLGWKFLLTLLIRRCSLHTSLSDREAVRQYVPSVNNLLPVFNYLTDKTTGNTIQYNKMRSANNWLTNPFTFPFYNVSVGTLRGTNKKTTLSYSVQPPAKKQDVKAGWEDGKPVDTQTTLNGDNTVSIQSAEIPGADNSRIIQETHTGIVSSSLGIAGILDFLGTAPQTVSTLTSRIQTVTEPTSGLFIIGNPANFWITDPDGHVTKDEDGIEVFTNPKTGNYKLFIVPKQPDVLVTVAQFLPNNKILWKDYTISGILPKFKTVVFDNDNPSEDALR